MPYSLSLTKAGVRGTPAAVQDPSSGVQERPDGLQDRPAGSRGRPVEVQERYQPAWNLKGWHLCRNSGDHSTYMTILIYVGLQLMDGFHKNTLQSYAPMEI